MSRTDDGGDTEVHSQLLIVGRPREIYFLFSLGALVRLLPVTLASHSFYTLSLNTKTNYCHFETFQLIFLSL